MKPKAALVKDGFLPAGSENVRGRLSGAAIERCKELAATGWDIEGYSVVKPTASAPKDAPVKVEKVKPTTDEIVNLVPMTRDECETKAFTSEGPVGMRTVCNVCRCSLTHCPCLQPRVWLDHEREGVVYFKTTVDKG